MAFALELIKSASNIHKLHCLEYSLAHPLLLMPWTKFVLLYNLHLRLPVRRLPTSFLWSYYPFLPHVCELFFSTSNPINFFFVLRSFLIWLLLSFLIPFKTMQSNNSSLINFHFSSFLVLMHKQFAHRSQMSREYGLWTVHWTLNHFQTNPHSVRTCSFFCQLSLI